MKPIYTTIDFIANYLRDILPQFSKVELIFGEKVEFREEEVLINAKVFNTKYIISISVSQYDTIVTYDCRVESEQEKNYVCEYEFNHEHLTLKETLDYSFKWINDNK